MLFFISVYVTRAIHTGMVARHRYAKGSNAPQDTPTGQTYPYTTFLESSLPIYAAPDVNSYCVQCVGEAGIYTILSEVWDADGLCDDCYFG